MKDDIINENNIISDDLYEFEIKNWKDIINYNNPGTKFYSNFMSCGHQWYNIYLYIIFNIYIYMVLIIFLYSNFNNNILILIISILQYYNIIYNFIKGILKLILIKKLKIKIKNL